MIVMPSLKLTVGLNGKRLPVDTIRTGRQHARLERAHRRTHPRHQALCNPGTSLTACTDTTAANPCIQICQLDCRASSDEGVGEGTAPINCTRQWQLHNEVSVIRMHCRAVLLQQITPKTD